GAGRRARDSGTVVTSPGTPPERADQSPRPPVPKPAPPPRPPVAPVGPAAAAPADTDVSEAEEQARAWGRVDEAGTVFVRTAGGERSGGRDAERAPPQA